MKKVKKILKKKTPKTPKKTGLSLTKKRVIRNKKNLLKALENCNGLVTTACKKAGLSRKTFYDYIAGDPDFHEAFIEIQEAQLDNSESKLHSLINQEEPSAIYFHLKCRGKERGYIERSQVEDVTNTTKQTITIGGREIEFE